MSHSFCSYQGMRDDLLIAYLYDDMEPAERARFDAHVAACPVCRDELQELGGVRAQLARWSPPEPRPLPLADHGQAPPARRRRLHQMLGDVPVWAQVAAALLVLGVSAGIANIEVRYDDEGFSVRTGWSSPAPSPRTSAESSMDEPWRAELAAVEQRLRSEVRALPASAAVDSVADDAFRDELMRRVRSLIESSERRQQAELALRVAEVATEAGAHRQADLVRVQRALDLLENRSAGAIMRNRQELNSLAQRAALNQRQ